ncbi:hypothetical protein Dimus_007469, partial [Dionaea muscipula]
EDDWEVKEWEDQDRASDDEEEQDVDAYKSNEDEETGVAFDDEEDAFMIDWTYMRCFV